MPITVKNNSNHHPDLFISCNRLMPTASEGKKINTLKTQYTGPNPSYDQKFCPAKLASTISTHIEIIKINRVKYQNSDRDARPVKSTYFTKQVLIEVIKSILPSFLSQILSVKKYLGRYLIIS